MKGRKLGGNGVVAEIDGGYFGGYVKPANMKESRRDRHLARNQNGKRKAVVIIRERNGRSLPAVFRTSSGNGVTINAGAGDSVHLRGLTQQGAGLIRARCHFWVSRP